MWCEGCRRKEKICEKNEMNKWALSIDVYYSDTECLMLLRLALLLMHFPWNKSITHCHNTHIQMSECLTSLHTIVVNIWWIKAYDKERRRKEVTSIMNLLPWNMANSTINARETIKTVQPLITPWMNTANIHTFCTETPSPPPLTSTEIWNRYRN